MSYIINGIQQVGIGVTDVDVVFEWYKSVLGFEIKMFDDTATADLMIDYTGGEPQQRRALMALSTNTGGGLEIWQFKKRKSLAPKNPVRLGDLGINYLKFKHKNIDSLLGQIPDDVNKTEVIALGGKRYFFMQDLWGNTLKIEEDKTLDFDGVSGACGVGIGVSDLTKSQDFYKETLGFDVSTPKIGFEELQQGFVSGEKQKGETLTITRSSTKRGGFAKLIGDCEIDLIQNESINPVKIFEGRYWGDLGFIHVCFDVANMDSLQNELSDKGYQFTVDSAVGSESFSMEDTAGRFAYLEDPDGSLIELVEVHKIDVAKKLGWSIDMTKRDPEKPFGNLFIWLLRKVKKATTK